MTKKYTFTEEEKQEIREYRENNRDKRIEKRLEALEMRAEGKRNKEISEKTGFHTQYITVLVSRYKTKGIASIVENHYRGNRRNLSYAEEEQILERKRRKTHSNQRNRKNIQRSRGTFYRNGSDLLRSL